MFTGGIDEAGRGPVIGPMVIVGVAIKSEKQSIVDNLMVKDSKNLSIKKRTELSWTLRHFLDCVVVKIIDPEIIDKWILNKNYGGLNELELKIILDIINIIKVKKVIIDCPDVNPLRFKKKIEMKINNLEIISSHKADENYSTVAIASIVAKIIRDREISNISEFYGDIGSGYPSDPKTINFLKKLKNQDKKYPSFVRKSWKTLNRI